MYQKRNALALHQKELGFGKHCVKRLRARIAVQFKHGKFHQLQCLAGDLPLKGVLRLIMHARLAAPPHHKHAGCHTRDG